MLCFPAEEVFISPKIPNGSPQSLLFKGLPEILHPVARRLWCEADHSRPSNADVQNKRSSTPIPPSYASKTRAWTILLCLLLLTLIFFRTVLSGT